MKHGRPFDAALQRVRHELSELAALGKVDDLLQRALDLAEPLTGSKIVRPRPTPTAVF